MFKDNEIIIIGFKDYLFGSMQNDKYYQNELNVMNCAVLFCDLLYFPVISKGIRKITSFIRYASQTTSIETQFIFFSGQKVFG